MTGRSSACNCETTFSPIRDGKREEDSLRGATEGLRVFHRGGGECRAGGKCKRPFPPLSHFLRKRPMDRAACCIARRVRILGRTLCPPTRPAQPFAPARDAAPLGAPAWPATVPAGRTARRRPAAFQVANARP